MRIRIALIAAVASLALAIVGVPAASADNGTASAPSVATLPTIYKVPVHGVAQNGRKFNGTYNIQRFAVEGNRVVSVGTLRGTFGNRRITRYNVTTPAALSQGSSTSGSGTGSGTAAAATPRQAGASCTILNLVLGPLNLRLLGLQLSLGAAGFTPGNPATQPIQLTLTGNQSGLLGQLLCGLTSGLGGSGGLLGTLNGNLQALASELNALVGIAGAL